jgi:hypothetical protein
MNSHITTKLLEAKTSSLNKKNLEKISKKTKKKES